jgi:hypothetical protein
MEAERSQAESIRHLEERLLRPDVRKSARAVADLHADEFMEFGSSGRIFDKQEMIAALQDEPTIQRSLLDFKTMVLASEVVLTTYRAVRRTTGGQTTYTLGSSIWRLVEGRWQMVFHQGTLTKEP